MERHKHILSIVIIYVIGFVCILSFKCNYHLDEMFSYGLSNHVGSNRFLDSYKMGTRYEDPYNTYLKYLAVSKDNRFNYKQVWINQKNDVHPPMYYVLLHTICSFFPESFSMWFAGIINIIFGILAVYFISILLDMLCDIERPIIKWCIMLGFIGASLHIVTFFRMYMMVMCLITAMEIYLIKLLHEPLNVKEGIILSGITLCGALTHYYFTFYLIISCFVCGLFMIMQRRWKDLLVLCCQMIAVGLAALAIFPPMIDHVLTSRHGVSSVNKLSRMSMGDYWVRIRDFLGYMNKEIFGGLMGPAIICMVVVCVCVPVVLRNIRKISLKSLKVQKYLFVLISLVLFFTYVSITASYDTDRYIFPIYGVVYVFFWGILIKFISFIRTDRSKTYIVAFFTIIIIIGSLITPNEYLYRDSLPLLTRVEKEYQGLDAVIVSEGKIGPKRLLQEVKHYGSIAFIREKKLEKILDLDELNDDDEFMLIVSKDYDVNNITRLLPMYEVDEKVGSWGYTSTYHMVKTGM